jgi:hypothetical protein
MRELAAALASAVPAIPPHVPSGAEILAMQARSFVQHAPPSAETVRDAPNQKPDRIDPILWAPILWAPRETHALLAAPGDIAARSSVPSPAQSLPTTLSASTGLTTAPPIRGRRRTPIVLAAVSCSLAGLAVYTLLGREAHDGPRSANRPLSPISSEVPAGNVPGAVDAMLPSDAGSWDVSAEVRPTPQRNEPKQHTEPPAVEVKRDASTAPRAIVKEAAAAANAPALRPFLQPTPRDLHSNHRPGNGEFDPNAVGGEE